MRTYLVEVHGTLLQTLVNLMNDYSTNLLLYKDGYYQIDSFLHTKLSGKGVTRLHSDLKGSRDKLKIEIERQGYYEIKNPRVYKPGINIIEQVEGIFRINQWSKKMQAYKLKNKENYKYFVKHYLEVMKEGKEAEAFLGTETKYRFRQRDSYELDSTDISVLMEYCLFPLYAEGDEDIARRTFDILKDFSLSADLVKLDKVTDYIFIQNRRFKRYISLPFVIKTDELVRNIIESIFNLSDEQKKDWLYQGLCNALDRDPLYRQCDEEKVEKILKEFKEKYYNPPKVVEL